MKPLKKYLIPAFFLMLVLNCPKIVIAESPAVQAYLPNNSCKSLSTPAAWGASNNVIFMGVGATLPAEYSKANDGAAVLGLGLGDPQKNVGIQIALVSLDLSQWDRYSLYVHLSKDLGHANAIGAGIENVMITSGGDSGKSFYAVYSQGVQADPFVNKKQGFSKLHFSIGAGSGRFGDKSEMDITTGKGKHGTYLFSNIAYEIGNAFNVITEWNGLNLNAGVSKTLFFTNIPIAVTLAAADLTKNSGDGVRFVFSVGAGFYL